ncbi:MAG: tRNA pseudouridine(38-40) synthase TruA [Alphaproteobacteria bacterium]|nr:tRNA pseudouridine(38-40) synthase TruA [Alphaproteobacteria bacterium]
MTRFKLVVEYDGGKFVGWQRQANGRSVQQALEEAVTRFCDETIVVHGAGRTDSGVHALAQVAHFDLATEHGADTVRDALNYHLKPEPVAVLGAEAVTADFHARFSAVERSYVYRIINRRPPLTLESGRAWQIMVPLDEGMMATAAEVLVGRHDFTSFRAANCQAKSPLRNLDGLDVERDGEVIQIRARARSFLHHQVRNMVGTLKLVGEGNWSVEDVAAALAARNRAAGGPTAPAHGLYLVDVRYPQQAFDPIRL